MNCDLSKTILAKSDQLNAIDLTAGNLTIIITEVSVTDSRDQPVVIRFKGDGGKPWKPCKSMRRVLVHAWGIDGKAYVGRSLELFLEPGVKYAGEEVGGIRIAKMSDIQKPFKIALTASSKKKVPFSVGILKKPENSGRENAEKWVESKILALSGVNSVEDLEALTSDVKYQSGLKRLKSERKDLHDKLSSVVRSRLEFLQSEEAERRELEQGALEGEPF